MRAVVFDLPMLTTLTFEGSAGGTNMSQSYNAMRALVSRIWRADRPLSVVSVLMLVVLAGALVGMVVDARVITGAPAWLKPAKFAASTAIYGVTLAWVFSYLPEWRRTRLVVGWTTASVFVLEVAIITVQAWRGTTSHFNVSTPGDAVLFAVMGVAIVQTIASGFVASALWRQPFTDRAIGTALRAGMIITLLGAASAGLMTVPTHAQVTELETTHRLTTSGAHTVGAPDGGPGLPGTGWSSQHGDLRVPHFFGLHALQLLPLLMFVLRRGRSQQETVRLVRVASVSYAALFFLLIVQALRGEALVAPGPATLGLALVWAFASATAFTLVRTRPSVRAASRVVRAL
jgi:hypothetical protein